MIEGSCARFAAVKFIPRWLFPIATLTSVFPRLDITTAALDFSIYPSHLHGDESSYTLEKSRLLRGSVGGNESNVPQQVHLALADPRPRQTYAISVSWLTWTEAKSQVLWGLSESELYRYADGEATSEFSQCM